MTPTDALELLQLRWRLTSGRAKFSDEVVTSWAEAIGDIPLEDMRTACVALTREGDNELRLGSIIAKARSYSPRIPDTHRPRHPDDWVGDFRTQQWLAALHLAKAESPIRPGEHVPSYATRLDSAIRAKLREIETGEGAA
jgi:hypothetical protein